MESTTNCWTVADLVSGFVARVVVSNPMATKAMASSKIKTDKVDSQVLAQLAFQYEQVKLLMTMPGVSVVVAQTLVAALGDINRFPSADKAASRALMPKPLSKILQPALSRGTSIANPPHENGKNGIRNERW